jgi:UDP-glucuronate decarboxylase
VRITALTRPLTPVSSASSSPAAPAFLGSHLCDRLLAGARGDVRRQLLHRHEGQHRSPADHPHFELLRHDVTFPLYVEVDEIYNLACPASPIHYQHDPVQTTKTSVHGAINMLGLAKRTVKAKIFRPPPAKSTAIRPSIRSRSLLGQRQPDRAALLLRRGQALRRDAVLRLLPPARAATSRWRGSSTPTGRACIPHDGRVVSNFIVQALQGRAHHHLRRRQPDPLVLLRDDLIDGFVRLMDSDDTITGPVNLGNPVRVHDSRAGRGLAQRALQWNPRVPLDEGLRRTVAYFRALLAA